MWDVWALGSDAGEETADVRQTGTETGTLHGEELTLHTDSHAEMITKRWEQCKNRSGV